LPVKRTSLTWAPAADLVLARLLSSSNAFFAAAWALGIACSTGIRLEPPDEAHASLGLIAPCNDWNWADAERHYERAIALDPNYATAHHWYAEGYLMPVGRADEAIAEMRKAQELDPLSAVIATDLGKELYFVRRYDDALVELRRALELDANFVGAHNWISDTLLEKRMYNEALAELEKTMPFKE
jgi:tetratricopeptide (TPR) repeat protein